jgi:hypothetical protein
MFIFGGVCVNVSAEEIVFDVPEKIEEKLWISLFLYFSSSVFKLILLDHGGV